MLYAVANNHNYYIIDTDDFVIEKIDLVDLMQLVEDKVINVYNFDVIGGIPCVLSRHFSDIEDELVSSKDGNIVFNSRDERIKIGDRDRGILFVLMDGSTISLGIGYDEHCEFHEINFIQDYGVAYIYKIYDVIIVRYYVENNRRHYFSIVLDKTGELLAIWDNKYNGKVFKNNVTISKLLTLRNIV